MIPLDVALDPRGRERVTPTVRRNLAAAEADLARHQALLDGAVADPAPSAETRGLLRAARDLAARRVDLYRQALVAFEQVATER